MADGLPVERLRAYLRELSAGARALLAAELERGLLRGDEMPGTDLILQELRAAMRGQAASPMRVADPARLFYKPTEPFLIDHAAAMAPPGRISRDCLTPLWEWIARDLVPGPAKAYAERVTADLLAGNDQAAAQQAQGFQVLVTQALGNLIASTEIDDKLRRRVMGQIGTPHALADIRNLFVILCNQTGLTQLDSRLPRHIGNMADEQLENITTLLHATARQNPDFLTLALVVVLNRLTAPWQLIRLGVKSAESDAASRIMQAPLGRAVTLVLADMRCAAAELQGVLKDGRIADCIALLKEIHDAVRGIRTELALGDTPWSREVAALRAGVSDMLKAEIESVPRRVRRLLRPRPSREIIAGSVLDPIEVAETEARIALIGACRNYASELAINQVASSAYSDIQSQLDTGNSALLDALRGATDPDRKYRQSQIAAAVRFSGKLLGADYAAMLAKAAASAAGERRTLAKA